MPFTTKIALIGDYNPSVTAHIAIPKAIEIANFLLAQLISQKDLHY